MIRNQTYYLRILILTLTGILACHAPVAAQNIPLTADGPHYQNLTNPSNLYVRDRIYKIRISLMQGGYLSSTPQSAGSAGTHISRLFDPKYWRNDGLESELLTPADRSELLSDHIGRHNSARFLNQAELRWLDIRWHGSDRSYAVSLKTRYASRFEIGRGLFSVDPDNNGDFSNINRSFHQNTQVLHELSFTTAESLTYLSGMLPNLSQFVVGISPKVILAGGYNALEIEERFLTDGLRGTRASALSYNQKAAGYMTQFGSGGLSGQPVPGFTRSNLLNPAGYGFGLDAGMSYMITLGDDLSLLNRGFEATRKAVRIHLSLTDIGAVYYSGETLNADLESAATFLTEEPATVERTFYGAPAEYIHFLKPLKHHDLDFTQAEQNESMTVFLPAAAHAGIDFRYDWFSIDGTAHYYFQDQAFSTSGLAVNSGIEIRPAPLLSLHAGAGYSPHQTHHYTGGLRLHTSWFDINTSALLLGTRGSNNLMFSGATGGVSFYLN